MKKEYKAFGGMFEFVIETGPDDNDTSEENRNDKVGLSNEDIPYEVRMKHIIESYRKDQEKWGKLAQYAKHLEGEVIRLKLILIDNGYTDSGIVGDYDAAEVISKLKKKIKKLEDKIENVYPRKQKSNLHMKRVMSQQASYIVQLQYLLDKNGISYLTPKPIKQLTQEDIDKIDENAVR